MLPYLSPHFGQNYKAHKVEDAHQRSQPTKFIPCYIFGNGLWDTRTWGNFFYKVRDKESARQNKRRKRTGKKSVGVQALLNAPADGQTWAFSY